MTQIGVRELKQKTSEVLRRVREEHATYDVTYRGRVVARLVPVVEKKRMTEEEEDRFWEEVDELAKEVSKYWPDGVSAVDAVREQRR